ncbi:unnamed protein product [Caenorhabditis sp. 36 PRJEB53466]|nr:unnamed protein product [Caenorhabditis sp. 36 PRJEB53466]
MPQLFISPQARSLYGTFADVRTRLKEKIINSDNDTRVVLDGAVFQYIGELDSLLQHPSVRGHRDPTMRTPIVHVHSTTGVLLKRMKRQIKAICTLADVVHIDPPANANEAEVLSRAQQVLNLLYDTITPPSSSSGSDCTTDSD